MLRLDKPHPSPTRRTRDSRCHRQHRGQWALCALLATSLASARSDDGPAV